MKKIAVIAVACMCTLLLTMCNKKDNPASSPVSVRLKDAPAIQCQKARLEIKGVKLFVHGEWVSVPMNDTIIDILQLRDTSALIGTVNVGAGTISQIDITLGSADTVTVGGADFLLSLTTTDLIIAVNDTITANAGSGFTITIDINAGQSIFDNDTDGIHHNYQLNGTASCSFRRGR